MRRASRATPEPGTRLPHTLRHVAQTVALSLTIAAPAAAAEGTLVLVPDPVMTFGLVALFVVIVFPVNAIVFRPILKALDDREKRIAGTRRRAEKLGKDAERILGEYQASIRTARESAEASRRSRLETVRGEVLETTTAARADAERELERARGELATSLETARTSLRAQAEELAREAASRVLGRAV
jgi:F-type H+-transporting ATPase subunit b